MSEFFEYDPLIGLRYDTEYDDGADKMTVHSSQDVEPVLDHMNAKRNKDDHDKGIKRGLWHYCSIPAHVELELRKKGLNIYDKNCTKDLLKEINTNYKYLKATRLNHSI